MNCPNCGTAAGDGATECASCGLLFAKWRERQEKEKREALEALKALESGEAPPPPNPWTGRLIAALLVAWWMLGLAVYYVYRFRHPASGPGN